LIISRDRAAAEAEQRYVETGPAEFALFHRRLRCAACLLVLLGARLLDNRLGGDHSALFKPAAGQR